MEWISFDTEDDSRELMEAGKSGFDKRVTQIAARSTVRSAYYSKGDCAGFLKWLTAGEEKTAYAHNLQYDLGNLFGDRLDELDLMMVRGRLIRARWKGIEFRDCFNLWPMSLRQLAPAFGLKKGKLDCRSREYVFGDVDIVHAAIEFVAGIVEQLGLARIPTTIGGLAVAIWRQTDPDHCQDSSELAQQAFYAGRVELFKVRSQSGRVLHCDITSLYASCMTLNFPGPLSAWPASRELPGHGIVEATVYVKRMTNTIPVLPYRQVGRDVIYPTGRFRGVWTIPELRFAVDQGARIDRVHSCLGSDESLSPYGQFVRETFQKRQAADSETHRLFWKLCLNNLYGRLGSTGIISRSVNKTEDNQFDGPCYGRRVLKDYQMPLDRTVNWCHAAYVASYGRMELWRRLAAVPARDLIYCDTDSVIFDCITGLPPWPVGSGLGDIRIVSEEEEAHVYAPKAYRVGTRTRAKGVPVRLAGKFLREGKVQFNLPFKLREAILFYDKGNRKQLSVWHRVTKRILSGYDRKQFKRGRFYPLNIKRQ